MQETIARPDVVAAVLGVAIDHLHVDDVALARLIGVEPRDVAAMRGGEPCALTREGRKALEGLAAIQSLLLSAFTPASAGEWMLEPNPALEARSPSSTLATGRPEAVGRVLRAALERVS